LIRYLRAFFIALSMTLRGVKPAPVRHSALRTWMEQTKVHVEQLTRQADAAGLDAAGRKALKVRVDGRDVSVESVLAAVRYHAEEEYPYLLAHETEHSLTAITAANLNDVYAVSKLHDIPEVTLVAGPLQTLKAHLEQIPESVNTPKS
jgi:hypothetical protein